MAEVVRLQDGDDIPNSDHVLRYCSPRHVTNGAIIETAFELRRNDSYLSVNWLEHFSGNRHQRLQSIRDSIAIKLSPNGRFAMLPVGVTKEKIKNIQIKYNPRSINTSHAGLYFSGSEKNREQTLELASIAANNQSFPSA